MEQLSGCCQQGGGRALAGKNIGKSIFGRNLQKLPYRQAKKELKLSGSMVGKYLKHNTL